MNADANMIVGVPVASCPVLRARMQERDPIEDPDDGRDRQITIRTADSYGQRTSANILVERMYATRGYTTHAKPKGEVPSRITLVAVDHDETIGTITVGFDSRRSLNVDELFGAEATQLRDAGRKVCEFTTLAMDSVVRSKRVLASLFHVAYIHAHRIFGCDDVLIEVNPRHVRYYERMLGFMALGEPKHNHRVNAPGVLMRLQFDHARRQIQRFAGHAELGAMERSLYPYFFSIPEETGIVARLKRSMAGMEHEAMPWRHAGLQPARQAGAWL